VRGAPEHLRSDNGLEFVAKEIQEWLARACVRTLSIQKASPWGNGYVESFNGRLRDELLDRLQDGLASPHLNLDLSKLGMICSASSFFPHGICCLPWFTPPPDSLSGSGAV